MLGLERGRPDPVVLVQLLGNQRLHALARARNDLWLSSPLTLCVRLQHPPDRQRGLGLAVLAQERWVDNNPVESALEVGGQFERLGEVVKDEFVGEDGEAVVVFQQGQLGLGLGSVGFGVEDVLELDEDGGGGDDGDGGFRGGAGEELFGEEGGCFVGVL